MKSHKKRNSNFLARVYLEIMSRALGSFLILILALQQILCQTDFERQILQRLENVEKAKEKLENENQLLKTKLTTISRTIEDMTPVSQIFRKP